MEQQQLSWRDRDVGFDLRIQPCSVSCDRLFHIAQYRGMVDRRHS